MSDVKNPFTPTRGARPPVCVGRRAQAGAVQAALDNLSEGRAHPLPVFAGVGGSGKTILLDDIASAATASGWFVGASSANGRASGRAAVGASLARAVTALHHARPAAAVVTQISEALAEFHPPSRDLLPVRPAAGSVHKGSLFDDLFGLLRTAGEGARELLGRGFVVIIDDAHALPLDDLSATLAAAAMVASWALPVLVLVAGSPSVMQATSVLDANTYALSPLGPLTEAETADALTPPLARLGLSIEPDALRKIHATSGGNPLLMQFIAAAAHSERDGPNITLDTVTRSLPIAQGEYQSGLLAPLVGALTPPARRYLLAVADLEPPVQIDDVARRVGEPRSFGRSHQPDAGAELLRHGVVFSVDGHTLQLSYPGARGFLRHTAR